MNTFKERILEACSAEHVPEAESGLWTVKKLRLAKPFFAARKDGKGETLPAGTWTSLFRQTSATMHLNGYGDLVMHDFPHEVRKHLQFMLAAHGHVLVSGLGLGCVVRGLLANPRVTRVTVLENSRDVLKLVGPFVEKEEGRSKKEENIRLEIVEAEAEGWIRGTDRRFDCAWHDLWTDTTAGEPHLAVKHAQMMGDLAGRVKFQGAWEFPRFERKLWRQAAGVI